MAFKRITADDIALQALKAKGVAGPDGTRGQKGDKGDKGEKGDTGNIGLRGRDGVDGLRGEPGLQGKSGKEGAVGDDGRMGDPGARGAKGDVGSIPAHKWRDTTLTWQIGEEPDGSVVWGKPADLRGRPGSDGKGGSIGGSIIKDISQLTDNFGLLNGSPEMTGQILTGQTLLMTGFNPDVDSGKVPEDCWPIGGLIDFATTAGKVSIVSTSANDTAVGTGAQTLLIDGVDSSFNEITETISLNGLTPVLTTKDFLHVQISTVKSAGVLQGNNGIITFTIDGGIVNGIAVGKSQTQSCARIIPVSIKVGTICHLINAFALTAKQKSSVATVTLITIPPSGVIIESLEIPLTSDSGNFILDLSVPSVFEVGSKIIVRITDTSSKNILVSAGLQFAWLEPS